MKENMFFGANAEIFRRAEELRNRMTYAEEILWNALHINEWHLKFRRQHPLANYIVDFYCHEAKLVIELDGNIHEEEEIKKNDAAREAHLKDFNLTVLRFKNEEVINNTKAVVTKIKETITNIQNLSRSIRDVNAPLGDGGKLFVIKIGGNIIDDETKLSSFLKDFSSINSKKILVHGGGKLATNVAQQLNIPQQLIDGRRITDAETLKVVTMVYAGYINKNITALLQSNNCNAIGLSGADGNLILGHKRTVGSPLGDGGDYGFVGDIDLINNDWLDKLLVEDTTPVIAPVIHDKQGQLLNTNADTIAQEVAKSMSANYEVTLVYCFEKKGVLQNVDDENSVIPEITLSSFTNLREKNIIHSGMIPKLHNAFTALDSGVKKIMIGKAEDLTNLIEGLSGTSIVNE